MWCLAALTGLGFAGAALAGPGDVYKVAGERVNLRAGPSNQAAVRSQILQGEDLIEVAQHGRWLGVRVLRTGEEGWIYGDLVRRTAQSTIGRRVSAAGFGRLSRDFDRLIEAINEQIGFPMVGAIDQGPNNTLRVTPTPEWMLNTGRDAKLYAGLALYQMWKGVSGRPANVVLVYNGAEYMIISDTSAGPVLDFGPAPVAVLSGG
jgi:hypothetical protein